MPGARQVPQSPPKHTPAGHRTREQYRRDNDAERGTPAQRGYSAAWFRVSKAFLACNPRCVCGCGQLATVVDHIRPHRGDQALFWDRGNWQPMAKRCHDRKTATIDRASGRNSG